MTGAELIAQAEALEWANKQGNQSSVRERIDMRIAELRAQAAAAEAPAKTWNAETLAQIAAVSPKALPERMPQVAEAQEPVAVVYTHLQYSPQEHGRYVSWLRNPSDIDPGTKLYARPDPRIAELEAQLAAAQAENDRLLGKACLICGAPKPCELAETEYQPCTFDPNPIQAARAFLDRAIKAEAAIKAAVLAEREACWQASGGMPGSAPTKGD